MRFLKLMWPLILAPILLWSGCRKAQITEPGGGESIAPNNLVVLRVGDGNQTLTSNATPVFLDIYTPSGTLVKTLRMPTTASGANSRFTISGTATSEGSLTQSVNGHYLFLAGYDADVGTAGVSSTAVATVNRVAARLDTAGNIDISTRIADSFDGNNARGACSIDGNSLWVCGASGGIRFTTLGSNTSTGLETALTTVRVVNIFNGQLYCSSSKSTYIAVSMVGTGTPTTSGQTLTPLAGMPTTGTHSPFAFSFSSDGKTLYVSDDGLNADGGGIQKWTSDGTNWKLAYTLLATGSDTLSTRGLVVDWSGAKPVLYATTAASTANLLIKITDTSATSKETVLATAAANTQFHGVAFAPK